MLPPAVQARAEELQTELKRLRRAFSNLPTTIPFYHEAGLYNSELTEAHGVYESLTSSPVLARVVAWLSNGFGSLRRGLSIPERGLRLGEAVEQLSVSVITISEQRTDAATVMDELNVLGNWISALINACAAAHLVQEPLHDASQPIPLPSPASSLHTVDKPSAVPMLQPPAATPAQRPIEAVRSKQGPLPQPRADKSREPPARPPSTILPALKPVRARVPDMWKAQQSRLDLFPVMSKEQQSRKEQELAAERAANREQNAAAAAEHRVLVAIKKRAAAKVRKRKSRATLAAKRVAENSRIQQRQLVAPRRYYKDAAAAAAATHRRRRKKKGPAAVEGKRVKTTWARCDLFKHLDHAARTVGFQSSTNIVNYVIAHDQLGQFQGLRPDVLIKWIKLNENGILGWSKSFLAAVAADGANVKAGCVKLVKRYPDVFEPALNQIRVTRAANTMISIHIARAIILAHVRRSNDKQLMSRKYSATFIRQLLRESLNWSYRCTTQTAQKVPEDSAIRIGQMFARIYYAHKMKNVHHPKLVINPDQVGLGLMPTGKKTWTLKGSKQVEGHGHNEKRQTTLVVASSCDGDLFPFQSVWGGVRNDSLPSTRCARREEADKYGFKYAHGDTRHWSSRETTIAWVETFLIPYHHAVCNELGFPEDEPMILLLDVWPVHIAKSSPHDFLPWLQRTYPWLHPIFIPGGYTCCCTLLVLLSTFVQVLVLYSPRMSGCSKAACGKGRQAE